MSRLVTLLLCSGEKFDGVEVTDLNVTLAEFLDASLKKLEEACKITLPETDEDLIDPRDFKVFDEDRSETFPLNKKLRDISYITGVETTPILYLDSPIFRSAQEVETDTKIDRIKKGTFSSHKRRTPYPPTRSVSLGVKGMMSKDHILLLAGRKEYTPMLGNSNRWQHINNPSDSTSLSEAGSINVPEEVLDRCLDSSPSVDCSSLHSFESSTSDVNDPVAHRKSKTFSTSSIPTKRFVDNRSIDSYIHNGTVDDHHLTQSSSLDSFKSIGKRGSSTDHQVPPKLLVKQNTLSEEEEIPVDTPVITRKFSLDAQKKLSTTSPEQNLTLDGMERLKSHDLSPSVSPKASRKVRLASRRGSNFDPNLHVGDVNPPSSPLSRQSGSSFNRTTFKSNTRSGSIVISPQHTRVFGNIRMFVVDFDIPVAKLPVDLNIRGDYTVAQIKENLWQHLRDQGHIVQELDILWDPERFTFTYEMNGKIYELYDGQQIFQTSTVAQFWRQKKLVRGKLTVELKKTETKEEKTLNMEISSIIGIGLYQLQFANNDELDTTRRKMVGERKKAVAMRDPALYSMETEVHFSELPLHVKSFIGDSEKLLIKVYYGAGAYQTFQVDMHKTADDFLPMVFPKDENKRIRLGIPEDYNIDDYILKLCDRYSYIQGQFELIGFSQIVKLLSKHKEIELALVKKLDTSLDNPRDIPDWNLIDESTGLTGTHEELSALSKEHTQIFTMSMWDIQRKFRVRVLGLDNLRNYSPEYDVVYVEVGVFHGGEELCTTLSTHEISSGMYPRWNQWLVFDIPVKNVPKAARLCIAINGGIRRTDNKKRTSTWSKKDTKVSSSKGEGLLVDRPLHWVNMQILDHRALLRQGVLKLNLWPYQGNGEDSRWGGMSPVGSTAINPDGNNAAVLYIELDSYMHPVACPTEGWGVQSVQLDSFMKESSPFRSDIDKSIQSDPLAPLGAAEKELLWNFRNQLVNSAVALPKFLQCVNWADLDQVTETHKLLKLWRTQVTMEIALELLDYHYADEKVRSLAVERLSKLTNDELLVFLLQLIQVLKFEPYHDSALARLLLKRALQSKRIGHYFFWYLRSEMDTPEFCQRFGILLEAYLKGCGEAMFKEIQRQHQAIQDIMKVAAGLKKIMEKHKSVTEYAKEELQQYKLSDSFAPPFDSGLKMGNLRIEKCRVMDSKKSPLWLEFENLDPTVLTQRPIKVIAKHGDDLRQDMLTLQMLALMDSLWQAKGLDLYIIPYGCIATGDGMGMIEVVQDAETVAKIQLHHGGSFSTLKDEPLHDWLKKKNPNPIHFEKAIERFMFSCAGYCVATYVLGIGDRHNDNIMLTTNGNLFHIDFGHFLGNTKQFMGVSRERAPFVLTPDFEYVLGKRSSETFRMFEETAVKAYLIIRENANLFINLFSMMKCTGIPELRSVEDLEYLRSVLVLDRSEEQAAEHFRQQIQKCLRLQWSTQLSWLAHNWVHRSS